MKKIANELNKMVGANLRKHRTVAGMSQDVLGKKLGVTFQQVQKYEQGINRISASTLIILTEILEVDINQLLSLEVVSDYETNRDALELMKNFKSLSESDKELVLMCARHLNKGEIK